MSITKFLFDVTFKYCNAYPQVDVGIVNNIVKSAFSKADNIDDVDAIINSQLMLANKEVNA